MIHSPVIKETIRENLTQPFFLMAALVGLASVLLFSFGVEFRYENDILTGMSFLGTMSESHVQFVSREYVKVFSGLLGNALMFLFIIGGSYTHTGMLQSPLTSVSLTRPLSRSGLFLSKFLGLWAFVTALMLVLVAVLWSIAFYKTSGNISAGVLLASLSFSLEFGIIFACSALIAMLVENPTGVAILSLAVYFFVGRLVGLTESLPPIVQALSLLLPPTGAMNLVTTGFIVSGEADFEVFLRGFPHAVISLGAGAYLFHRKDLR